MSTEEQIKIEELQQEVAKLNRGNVMKPEKMTIQELYQQLDKAKSVGEFAQIVQLIAKRKKEEEKNIYNELCMRKAYAN